jgi:competence protein ComEC
LIEEEQLIQLRIKSTLKPDLFNNKYVAEIQYADGVKVSGKLLLLVTKEIHQEHYQVGDLVLTFSQFQELPSPKNPYQFDYGAYLNKQGIYHQIQVRDSLLIQHFKGRPGFRGKAAIFRDNINKKLRKDFHKYITNESKSLAFLLFDSFPGYLTSLQALSLAL